MPHDNHLFDYVRVRNICARTDKNKKLGPNRARLTSLSGLNRQTAC